VASSLPSNSRSLRPAARANEQARRDANSASATTTLIFDLVPDIGGALQKVDVADRLSADRVLRFCDPSQRPPPR
jgi:hypothetical protein